MVYCRIIYIGVFLLMLCISQSLFADEDDDDEFEDDDEDSARIYQSPEERRETGLGTKINEWITFFGSLEIEKEYLEDNFINNKKIREYGDTTPTLEFAFELSVTDWFGAELVYEVEYENDQEDAAWDEAFVYFDFEDIGLSIEAGRISVPFGEYYSYFITEPLLEFSEVTKNGIVVDYTFFDMFETSVFAIDGDVDKQNKSSEYDWGALVEYVSENENLRIGVGYLSDLAESDERPLRDENDFYHERVAAWNAYALIGFDKFEITAEVVQAANRFREFDIEEDKPQAFNIEFAYFPSSNIQFAFRYEQSDEIEEEPEKQYGMNISWQPVEKITLSLDYLHGEYKNNFVFDDDDNELSDRDLIAMEFSVEF